MLSCATSKLLKSNCHSIPICVEFELIILEFIHLNLRCGSFTHFPYFCCDINSLD